MRRRYISGFLVFLGVLGSIPEGAQGYPYAGVEDPSGSAATGLYAMGRNAELGQVQNPGNSVGAVSVLEEYANMPVGRSFNPNVWCPNGDNCGELVGNEPPKPNPGARIRSINALSPMSGFQSIVNSMAYSNQAANALVTPMTLMNVAMQLTEPGISAGLSMALNNVNQALQSRFLANQAFIANASVSPEGMLALRAYQDCMHRKMTATTERKTWPQADAECQGGETITNVAGLSSFSSVSPAGFNLNDDYDHASGYTPFGVPEEEPDRMKLSDYLFNPETDFFASDESNALRASFVETVGDISFSVTPGNTGARRLFHTRVRPEISPEELHRRHTTVVYNLIHEVLFGQCLKYSSSSPVDPNNRRDYYLEPQVQELVSRVAVVGHMTARPVFQSFFREYKESLGRVSGEFECQNLRSWENTETSLDNLSNGGEWGVGATRMSRIIFSYAQLIGRLKTLNTYLTAEQVVKSLSVGSFDNTIRNLALDMVYDVAGTRDIQREYDTVLARIKEFAQAVVAENQDRARER